MITGEKDVDLRKNVFETFAKEGITIFEMKKVDATLEDAFMKLISDSTEKTSVNEEKDLDNNENAEKEETAKEDATEEDSKDVEKEEEEKK